MGTRSYVPQLGRFLQPDPMPGGSANAYSYTFDDPINSTDPTGDYVEGTYLNAYNNDQNQLAVEHEIARETAAREAAEKSAREAAEAAAAAAGPQYTSGEEEFWEEWEEEDEYEYASYHHGTKAGRGEAHTEPALLVQPFVTTGEGMGNWLGVGSRVPVKGGAECFSGSGCARKDRALRRGGSGQTEEHCVKGVAAYILLGTPADAMNPLGIVAGCLVGILLG